jgi:hypothetical protein
VKSSLDGFRPGYGPTHPSRALTDRAFGAGIIPGIILRETEGNSEQLNSHEWA